MTYLMFHKFNKNNQFGFRNPNIFPLYYFIGFILPNLLFGKNKIKKLK